MPSLKYQNYAIALQDIQYLQIMAWQCLTMRETSVNANHSRSIRHISSELCTARRTESKNVHISGLIVKAKVRIASTWKRKNTFSDSLSPGLI